VRTAQKRQLIPRLRKPCKRTNTWIKGLKRPSFSIQPIPMRIGSADLR